MKWTHFISGIDVGQNRKGLEPEATTPVFSRNISAGSAEVLKYSDRTLNSGPENKSEPKFLGGRNFFLKNWVSDDSRLFLFRSNFFLLQKLVLYGWKKVGKSKNTWPVALLISKGSSLIRWDSIIHKQKAAAALTSVEKWLVCLLNKKIWIVQNASGYHQGPALFNWSWWIMTFLSFLNSLVKSITRC